MALGSFAFPGVPDLPSTEKEMSTCHQLPATESYQGAWLSAGQGPRVPPPAQPLRARALPGRAEGLLADTAPEAQVSAGSS